MKNRFFILPVVAAALLFSGASVWEGAAAVSGDFPEDGLYVATNSFPRNTVVDLTNLETGKTVRVIVSAGLDAPGLLAVVSREAAEAVGLQSRTVGRIRIIQPADPMAFSRFSEDYLRSGDPDYDPRAAVEDAGRLPGTRMTDENPTGTVTWGPGSPAPEHPMEPEKPVAQEKPKAETPARTEPPAQTEPPELAAASRGREQDPDNAWAGAPAETAPLPAEVSPAEVPSPPPAETAPPPEEAPPAARPQAGPYRDPLYDPYYEPVYELLPPPAPVPPPETRVPSVPPPPPEEPAPGYNYSLIPAEERPPRDYTPEPELPEPEFPLSPAGVPQTFSVPAIADLEYGKYYVQLGTYSQTDVVEQELSRVERSYPLTVQCAKIEGKFVYRILVGPVNRGESGALLRNFRGRGYRDSFIKRGGE